MTALITVAMSTVIDAERSRVWRALTDASERTHWDVALLAPIEERVSRAARSRPSKTGAAGSEGGAWTRWRYRMGSVQTVMRERSLEIEPLERLRSEVAIGSFSYARTFTLSVDPESPERTRLSMKLVSSSAVPLVGATADRFEVRKIVSARIDSTLRSVQEWCERGGA